MTATEISNILNTKGGGQIFTVVSRRPAKLYKGVPAKVEKESTFQGMLAAYANTKAVREAVKEGLRDEPQLPDYIKEVFFIGKTRFWRGRNDQVYLPIPISGNKPSVQWFLNGRPCKKEDVANLVLASELAVPQTKSDAAEKWQSPFVAIKVENVLAVH